MQTGVKGLAEEWVTLRDGTAVGLRIAGPADELAVAGLFRRVSRESLRLRFCTALREVSPELVRRLLAVNLADRAAVVAVSRSEGEEVVLGLGSYARLDQRDAAEVALLVDDRYQGRGLGRLLLHRLASLAWAQGLRALEAEVLAENGPMLRLLFCSGLRCTWVQHQGTVWVQLAL